MTSLPLLLRLLRHCQCSFVKIRQGFLAVEYPYKVISFELAFVWFYSVVLFQVVPLRSPSPLQRHHDVYMLRFFYLGLLI